MDKKTVLRRIFDGFLESLGFTEDTKRFSLETGEIEKELLKSGKTLRSTSMARLREQLYYALEEAEGGWAYPLDIFVDNDGKGLFAIVAQSGKLFQVPLTVSNDNLAMGEWLQVKEEFTPISQSRHQFTVRRQKDGTYRWLCIAGTTVLNRVGEIDSSELFDSFIEHAERTGEYPRLDFYHLGSADPKAWEFGTADYLAREGVCYIASGTFDPGHPLAEATIKACERDGDIWGNSIEFYAFALPELLTVDPEIRVPMYKRGKNTRISVVLEEDAAGLFTRLGVNEGVTRAMDEKIKEVLKRLYGEDEEGLNAFVESVDTVNQRVRDDKLIHRAKTEESVEEDQADEDQTDEDQTDEEEDDEETAEDSALVLDEAAVEAIAQQLDKTEFAKSVKQSIDEIKALVAELVVARQKDSEEIAALKRDKQKLTQKIQQLDKDESEKQTEWLQDLPSKRNKVVTYRARDVEESEEEDDLETIANRTLNGIPSAY